VLSFKKTALRGKADLKAITEVTNIKNRARMTIAINILLLVLSVLYRNRAIDKPKKTSIDKAIVAFTAILGKHSTNT
jgi:hypothetical protein